MALVHNTVTPDIETASEAYRSRFAGEVGQFFLSVQQLALASCLQRIPQKTLKILDLGGGHGQVSEYLLSLGHELVVQGSSEECFNYLKPLVQKYPGRISFIASPLWAVPVSSGSFDLVISLRLLAHVENWKEILAEMARISRGPIIFDFAALSALNVLTPLLFGLKRKIEGNTRPYFSYSGSQIKGALNELGLCPGLMYRQFFFPMGLHRSLKNGTFSRGLEGLAAKLLLTKIMGSPVMTLALPK